MRSTPSPRLVITMMTIHIICVVAPYLWRPLPDVPMCRDGEPPRHRHLAPLRTRKPTAIPVGVPAGVPGGVPTRVPGRRWLPAFPSVFPFEFPFEFPSWRPGGPLAPSALHAHHTDLAHRSPDAPDETAPHLPRHRYPACHVDANCRSAMQRHLTQQTQRAHSCRLPYENLRPATSRGDGTGAASESSESSRSCWRRWAWGNVRI